MVESLYLYNTKTKNRILMNMTTASYLIYEGSIDWGTIEVTHNTFQYPTQIGYYNTTTSIGSRDITIAGWIIGKTLTEIEQKKKTLSKSISPFYFIDIEVGDYSIQCKPNKNVSFSKTYAENNDKMCKFLIEFECFFPLFKLKYPMKLALTQEEPAFRFPLILPEEGIIMSSKKNSLFVDILNDGAVSIGAIFTLTATATVNYPTIIDINTLSRMKLNKTLIAGEVVTISTLDGEHSVVGQINGVESNYFDYFDYDNDYLELAPGTTTLTYTTESSSGVKDDTYANLDISIEFNPCKFNLDEE